MAGDNWALHHSLLSPYLNNGLLHASEVIDAVLAAYRNDNKPIGSVEAFVRQVIGWREYINGMYWFLGPDYREKNELGATRKLLDVTDWGTNATNTFYAIADGATLATPRSTLVQQTYVRATDTLTAKNVVIATGSNARCSTTARPGSRPSPSASGSSWPRRRPSASCSA